MNNMNPAQVQELRNLSNSTKQMHSELREQMSVKVGA